MTQRDTVTGMTEAQLAEADAIVRAFHDLIWHLRRCRNCSETDVMNCFEGKQLWEDANMPEDG